MLQIKMEDLTLKDIKNILETESLSGKIEYLTKQEFYNWLTNFLKRLQYQKLCKKEKSEVLTFLYLFTDYKPGYIRKLVSKAAKESLRSKQYARSSTPKKYSTQDVLLLAQTDIAHQRLNSHATKHILERESNLYGHQEYENISKVSSSHIYNLRERNAYDCAYKNGTKARVVDIGETKKPQPNGKPGSIRVDTVHQRDIYYINAIDEVLQWELIFAVPKISEFFLEPILELMLQTFPFKIFNFHSDRGSEYINHTVAKLLNKLMIHQTKSRSRHCNDQALVECKNGCVIRKHMGYGYIAQEVAPLINRFCVDYMNIYVNFHRPCAFRNLEIEEKEGRIVYDTYLTPYERLKPMDNALSFLKPNISLSYLNNVEMEFSDNEFADILQIEKEKIRKLIAKGKKIGGSFPLPV
ncbi:DDE-type integrase/transposase/recombinase [Candidatus Dojkabacteria bacterium]|nr:DDE-type integrase/transposase/recombinase [Candidatus Dojkabacteria bacterium]